MTEHSGIKQLHIPLPFWFPLDGGYIPLAALPPPSEPIITVDDAVKAYPEYKNLVDRDHEYGKLLVNLMYVGRMRGRDLNAIPPRNAFPESDHELIDDGG